MVAINKGYRRMLAVLDCTTPGLTRSHGQTMDAVCLAHKWYMQIIGKPKKQTRNKKRKGA